jgi:hypothetical protein
MEYISVLADLSHSYERDFMLRNTCLVLLTVGSRSLNEDWGIYKIAKLVVLAAVIVARSICNLPDN